MPQFDFYSFSTQNFWVLLFFISLYFFFLSFYLNNFSEIKKMRYKLIFFYNKPMGDLALQLKHFLLIPEENVLINIINLQHSLE